MTSKCYKTGDPDEARAIMGSVLGRRPRVIDRRGFSLEIQLAEMKLLSVATAALEGGMQATIELDADAYSLARIENGWKMHGALCLQAGDGYLSAPGAEWFSAATRFSGLFIRFPAAELRRRLEAHIDDIARQPLVISEKSFRRAPLLNETLDLVAGVFAPDDFFERYPLHGERIEKEFIDALINETENNYQERLWRRGDARRPIALFREYMEEHWNSRESIADIALLAGVNLRALRKECKERNTSPVLIRQNARLKEARRRLLETDDSIELIAGQCGFTNPGRMTRAYALRYGELPSAQRAFKATHGI